MKHDSPNNYGQYLRPIPIFPYLAAVLAVFSVILFSPITAYAHNTYDSQYLNGIWQKDQRGWWFENSGNPAYISAKWGEYRSHSYYFDSDGYMVTGWQYLDGYWYYFNTEESSNEGAMMTGWRYDPANDGWFYLSDNGVMVTGWHKLGGYWYYFNPGPAGTLGKMAANQLVDNSYVDSNGRMNDLPN